MRARRNTLRTAGLAATLVMLASSCDITPWASGGDERPFYCDPTDTAVNDGHGGGAHGGHTFPYTEEKGPLSAADCLALNVYVASGAALASQFPTAGVAEANGWSHLAPFIPGQGTHHVNVERGVTSEFDPWQPNMLMYDSNSNSAELTGMVWVVESGPTPPEGFPGDNDHWHSHQDLCFIYNPDPFIVGDNISDEACAARGGVNEDWSDTWLLHVWMPEYEGWEATDIFNKTHPTV